MKQAKGTISPSLFTQLREVIEADPEDTFFLPSFPDFLREVIAVDWNEMLPDKQQLNSIIKFELIVIEECLLALTFGEDILRDCVNKCRNYLAQQEFQAHLLWTLFRLSEKVVFIEDYQLVAALWSYLEE